MKSITNIKISTWDLVVIGGGPAGMMAAGRAAEVAKSAGREAKILLLEKNDILGKKLLITGGGRCNVTNAEFDDRALLAKFKDSAKFLFSAFSQHSVRESLAFLNDMGMPTKVENEKRVFPVSDSAKSVWEVLLRYLGDGGVRIKSNSEVVGFIQAIRSSKPVSSSVGELAKDNQVEIEAVKLRSGEIIKARSFILATGGKSHPETGSTGESFQWLKKLGHNISEPTASLVPIKVSDPWVKKLSGFSLPDAKLTLFQNGVKQTDSNTGRPSVRKGKILFTHVGLSGPSILNMSSEIGELLKYGDVVLSLDLLPEHDYATLNSALVNLFGEQSNKKFKNALGKLIPSSLVSAVVEKSNINPDTFCNSVTREERLLLVKVLKDMHIHPTSLLGTDKAIITSGGVALEEIDWKTMKSRLVPNLQIIGDLLDIERPSGGYSLQLCWTTGWVAGNAIFTNSDTNGKTP